MEQHGTHSSWCVNLNPAPLSTPRLRRTTQYALGIFSFSVLRKWNEACYWIGTIQGCAHVMSSSTSNWFTSLKSSWKTKFYLKKTCRITGEKATTWHTPDHLKSRWNQHTHFRVANLPEKKTETNPISSSGRNKNLKLKFRFISRIVTTPTSTWSARTSWQADIFTNH